ncbi:hypothetical protein HRbin21_01576 [bacterium HR21]|jgi:hypothetical protein|nr:hypothetical protein HRbin21_01576 [bacterium HR21]
MGYRRFWKGMYVADKRGITGFRMKPAGNGTTLRLAITRQPGPRGGRTVAIGRITRGGKGR